MRNPLKIIKKSIHKVNSNEIQKYSIHEIHSKMFKTNSKMFKSCSTQKCSKIFNSTQFNFIHFLNIFELNIFELNNSANRFFEHELNEYLS